MNGEINRKSKTGIKKILIVSNGFYPEISPRSYRATELAKEFCRQGHQVTVISKFREYDYADFLTEFPLRFKMWGRARFPQVPQFKSQPFSFFSRILFRTFLILFEYPGIEDMFKVKKALDNIDYHDMVISFAIPYPVHWGVAWSRTRKHMIADIWIADCGDPYMGDVLDTFRKPFYFRYLEKWFCRKANYLTVPIEGAIKGYYPEFHHKIRIIPQGFHIDLADRPKKMPDNPVPTFAYAGGFITGVRDPGPFLDYLMTLMIPFCFHIYTNQPEFLEHYRNYLKEKLIVSKYIPRNELLEILSGMDFLINFDNNTSLNSPSKLIDYAIADRPVLNITREIDRENIYAFLKGDYKKKMQIPDPVKFNIKNISKLFLDLSVQ